MVFITLRLLKNTSRHRLKFIDSLRIHVRAGKGGQGLSKYGGTGGRGGSIYLEGSSTAMLKHLKCQSPDLRFKAAHGEDSRRRSLFGAPGEDLVLEAPVGVTVKTDAHIELGDINEPGDRILIASGGDGGAPCNAFNPQPGQAHSVRMDLKLIADIGLVGFPNAGKSTFLRAVSRATPKIAAYPFTTIRPQIGVMNYGDSRQISLADLPGLIEGAHVNVGMGHNFLKHVERTKMLLFIVDACGFRLGARYPMRTAAETVLLLNKELELYKQELTTKPAIVAINKIDLPGGEELADEAEAQIKSIKEFASQVDEAIRPENIVTFDKIFKISARKKQNTQAVKESLRTLLDIHAEKEKEKELEGIQSKNQEFLQTNLTEHHKRILI